MRGNYEILYLNELLKKRAFTKLKQHANNNKKCWVGVDLAVAGLIVLCPVRVAVDLVVDSERSSP